MSTTAETHLSPKDPRIVVRVAFLYVGQGSSALFFLRDGAEYSPILVDINLDRKAGGIDVPKLLKDLLGDASLDAFMNTHPHDDHLKGVEELAETVTIRSIFHSGHVPSKKHGAAFDGLEKVIKKVEDAGDDVVLLVGSKSSERYGEADFHVLAPAEYVTDEVNDEDPDVRYRRIHEQSAVLKFGYKGTWIMIPGDADRAAFEKHITDYHLERMGATVLAASHHGSRTFFQAGEEEPYTAHLEAIAPTYVVISAPTQAESRHEHPDSDAVERYEDAVGENNVLHTGEERYTFIFDILDDGTLVGPTHDSGELWFFAVSSG